MDTKEIIKDIKVKELISGIVDNISPTCYYPVLYSRKQMEQAMEELAKKVMEMQTGKIKELESRQVTRDGSMSTTTGMIGENPPKWVCNGLARTLQYNK